MNVSHFGHIIAFYALLVVYNEVKEDKTKEERKDLFVQLTIQSLTDFERYKKNRLQEKKTTSSLDFFYNQIKPVCLTRTILGLCDFILQQWV